MDEFRGIPKKIIVVPTDFNGRNLIFMAAADFDGRRRLRKMGNFRSAETARDLRRLAKPYEKNGSIMDVKRAKGPRITPMARIRRSGVGQSDPTQVSLLRGESDGEARCAATKKRKGTRDCTKGRAIGSFPRFFQSRGG